MGNEGTEVTYSTAKCLPSVHHLHIPSSLSIQLVSLDFLGVKKSFQSWASHTSTKADGGLGGSIPQEAM